MPKDLADLFGVTRDGVRWERPLLIVAADFGAQLFCSLLPSPSFQSVVGQPGGRLVWDWPGWGDPGWLALSLILACLSAAVPFVGFVLVRRAWVVIPVAALILSPLRHVGYWLLSAAGASGSGEANALSLVARRAALGFVSDVIWLSCVALALQLIRSRAGALFGGYLAGGALTFLLWQGVSPLLLPRAAETSLTYLLVSLGETLVWQAAIAIVLWVGLRLTTIDGTATAARRASRPLYAGTSFAAALIGELLVAVMLAEIAMKHWHADVGPPAEKMIFVAGLGVLALLLIGITLWLVVIMCVLVYKAWAAIQDGHTPVSPAWAVGGLFIPVFNLYWVFRVWAGFPGALNAFADRARLDTRLRPGLFIAFCILALLSSIPVAGSLFGLINVFIRATALGRVCDAINAIPRAPRALQP